MPGTSGRTAVPGASGRTAVPGASGRTAVPGTSGRTAVPGASGRTAVPGAGGRIQAFGGLSSLPQGLFLGQNVRLRIFGPAFCQICSDLLVFGQIILDPGSGSRVQAFSGLI